MNDTRTYPARPILAVSAAIVHNGRVLIARRAKPPANGLFTLPGGVVEVGENLHAALKREVMEETAIAIEPVVFVDYREILVRHAEGRVARHFVVLAFACRWLSGEPVVNDELAEARWMTPERIADLKTTEGLAEIVAKAFTIMGATRGS